MTRLRWLPGPISTVYFPASALSNFPLRVSTTSSSSPACGGMFVTPLPDGLSAACALTMTNPRNSPATIKFVGLISPSFNTESAPLSDSHLQFGARLHHLNTRTRRFQQKPSDQRHP